MYSGLSGLSAISSIQNAWDPFRVAPTWAVTLSGTSNIGLTVAGQRWFLTTQNDFLIRQDGKFTQAKIPSGNLDASWTEFYLSIWRKRGTVYDLIATTGNLKSQITAANTVTTLTISPAINVLEGDYIGYSIKCSGVASNQLQSVASTTGQTRYVDDVEPHSIGYDWGSKTGTENSVKIGIFVTEPPRLAEIGDSIISGYPNHHSYVQSSITVDVDGTIGYKLSKRLDWLHQNWGIGGETTTAIAARIGNITGLPTQYALLAGGTNDIVAGASQATFTTNWTTILDACVEIVPIVLKLLPWTDGTTVQMQTRDTWNAALATLAASYPGAIVVDCSTAVGLFRAGGDAGNLWDIQAAYDADGVHYNEAGYTKIANTIYDAIIAATPAHTTTVELFMKGTGNTSGPYVLLENTAKILLE